MEFAHFLDIHLGIDEDDHARVAWLLGDAVRGADRVVSVSDVLEFAASLTLTGAGLE